MNRAARMQQQEALKRIEDIVRAIIRDKLISAKMERHNEHVTTGDMRGVHRANRTEAEREARDLSAALATVRRAVIGRRWPHIARAGTMRAR